MKSVCYLDSNTSDIGTESPKGVGGFAFELHEDGQIVVSRADAEHEDPAIGAFLDLLAGDIRAGRHVRAIPDDLAQDMLEHAQCEAGPDEDIDGDVAL